MGAVPKKKLCWNCEGNVAREIDNCPYCGVYVHSPEFEEESSWGLTARQGTKAGSEAPSPIYTQEENEEKVEALEPEVESQNALMVSTRLRKDLFPVLFLMSGSLFFIFGSILFIFSGPDGTFTLQWNANHWFYFLGLSFPLLYLGWKYLQELDREPSSTPHPHH